VLQMAGRGWLGFAALTIMGTALFVVGGAAPAVASAPGGGAFRGAPMIPAPTGAGATAGPSEPVLLSTNWSGYVATSNTRFDSVAGEFVQPSIVCDGLADRYVAVWTGLDGYRDNTLEQDGTFATCGGAGHRQPEYVAWYEMFPLPSVMLFPVNAGDRIKLGVTESGGSFTLSLADATTGQRGAFTAPCRSCRRDSAEWIVERPELCSKTTCFLSALPNFGTATVTGDSASTDGNSPESIASYRNVPLDMIQPVGSSVELLDQTNPLTKAGSAFSTVWQRTGTRLPLT
jgi:hypothetical protein